MDHDQALRLVLIIGMAVVFPIGMYHRFKSYTGEPLDRLQEGWFILLTLRLGGLAHALGLFTYIGKPALMEWSQFDLPVWIRWSGVAFGVAGAFLLTWTFRTLGPNLTDTVVTRKKHALVTNGPYRWVRHPFYVAAGLAVIANSLVTANWFLAGSGVVLIFLLWIRTKTEEENLLKRFGDDYSAYMERTGRFIPSTKR